MISLERKGKTIKYIYTAENCPRCHDLLKHYDDLGIFYTERASSRLTKPTDDRDEVDIDAFVLLSQQNMVLPVEIDTKGVGSNFTTRL